MSSRHNLATQGECAKALREQFCGYAERPQAYFSPKKRQSATITLFHYSSCQIHSVRGIPKAFQPPQELIDRPRKAQKQKHAAKDEHSQKRLQKDSPSVLVSTAASQDLVGVWQTKGKKRSYNSEDNYSYKRRRRSVPESQLSEENLKKLERDLETLEKEMSDKIDPSATVLDRVRKRAPSRQASFSDLNQDTASLRSQKLSVSNSFYRYHILDQARIYVRPEPPPMDIQAQMDVIFEREISEKRRKEISGIAKKISQSFINNLRGAHREDDLVKLIYEAFRMMHKDESFDFPRKADWDLSLKPDVQPEVWNWDALGKSNNKADGVIDRPNKRQQGEQSFSFPDTSQSTIPSPTTLSQFKQDAVKTPRPDFTIGLRHSTISNALIKRGLSKFKADDFLQGLQRERKLYSNLTQNFLNVRFPILVIEGKAYATGKTVFEAQNQASVSGGCMVNLRQQLTDLFEGVFLNLRGRKTHLAFSICTEGPQIEFWVHYALSEDNVRSHYMNIFRMCYRSLQGGLEDFLMDVERLMRWTKDEFLKEVADQL
ncbi:hypothetical protein MMC07_009028, partial [Pseudocyphellaria aurata]|nr:hypothetical protein [Pseudocyphellaria aurata]